MQLAAVGAPRQAGLLHDSSGRTIAPYVSSASRRMLGQFTVWSTVGSGPERGWAAAVGWRFRRAVAPQILRSPVSICRFAGSTPHVQPWQRRRSRRGSPARRSRRRAAALCSRTVRAVAKEALRGEGVGGPRSRGPPRTRNRSRFAKCRVSSRRFACGAPAPRGTGRVAAAGNFMLTAPRRWGGGRQFCLPGTLFQCAACCGLWFCLGLPSRGPLATLFIDNRSSQN